VRELIRNLRAAGKCVLFSSHIMQEVAALCDRIVIIGRGRIVAEGTPEDIAACPSSHTGRFLRELFSKPSPRPGRQVEQEPSIESQPVSQ
jgi:ABC-type Na+ transport system ATPase subunit NatA